MDFPGKGPIELKFDSIISSELTAQPTLQEKHSHSLASRSINSTSSGIEISKKAVGEDTIARRWSTSSVSGLNLRGPQLKKWKITRQKKAKLRSRRKQQDLHHKRRKSGQFTRCPKFSASEKQSDNFGQRQKTSFSMGDSNIAPETNFSCSFSNKRSKTTAAETARTLAHDRELIAQWKAPDIDVSPVEKELGRQVCRSSLPDSSVNTSNSRLIGFSTEEDISAILHTSCTVPADQASNIQLYQLRSYGSLVCVECGMRFQMISLLQKHIQNKAVWTNRSILGDRVSIMWANNQWFEGTVTQYDTMNGRHCVEYDDGENKWYHMANKTFYILSDKHDEPRGSRDELGMGRQNHKLSLDGHLGDIESKHGTDESLSKNYVLAQSIVHMCFGNSTQQVGYRTDGHLCITDHDRVEAHNTGASLLYGEVLPRGCNKILDSEHLNAAECKSLYDLGMGTGKFALQAFVQFPNLDKVVGVELAQSRFVLGEKAALTLVAETRENGNSEYRLVSRVPSKRIVIAQTMEDGRDRILEFRKGNLFAATDCHDADIVIAQTNFPAETQVKLCRFLGCLKPGCRILTYLNLWQLWKRSPMMFRQMDINRSHDDRFATSWSMHRGCHFYLWERMYPGACFEGQKHYEGGPSGDYLNNFAVDSGPTCFSAIFRCCSGDSARIQNSPDYNDDKY